MHSKYNCPDICYLGQTKPTFDSSSALRTHCCTVTALASQLFPEMQTDWKTSRKGGLADSPPMVEHGSALDQA